MMNVPTPAEAGLNTFELTPVPEYVPPLGVPVFKVNEAALLQILPNEFNTTVGNGFTVNTCEVLRVHPAWKVTVYVIVWVPTDGSKIPALTPVPLNTPPAGEPPLSVCKPAPVHTGVKAAKVGFDGFNTVTTAVPDTVPLHTPLVKLTKL